MYKRLAADSQERWLYRCVTHDRLAAIGQERTCPNAAVVCTSVVVVCPSVVMVCPGAVVVCPNAVVVSPSVVVVCPNAVVMCGASKTPLFNSD